MALISEACVMSLRMFIQSVRSKPRMYVYALLDSVLAVDVKKYPVTTASCQQRWWTNWIHLHLYLAAEQRTLGCLVTTNHNKAVRGLVSQPITANVGHLTWQLSMATLLMASADPEALSALEVFFTTMRYINLPHFTFEECYVGKYKNTHRCCRWLKMFCCIIIAACVIGICVFFQQSVKINSTVDGVEAFVNSSSSPVL